jgi:hypothetical protein
MRSTKLTMLEKLLLSRLGSHLPQTWFGSPKLHRPAARRGRFRSCILRFEELCLVAGEVHEKEA